MEQPTRGRSAGALAIALLVLWLWPASGIASTVRVGTNLEPVYGDEVLYTAAPGERNDVSLRMAPDPSAPPGFSFADSWVVSDPGAVIHPGESCTTIDAHTAECQPRRFSSAPGVPSIIINPVASGHVLLGDRDDRLLGVTKTAAQGGWVVASGGAGDDRMTGGAEHDELRGGAGDDRLVGAAGGDRLDGGGGHDRLHGGAGGDSLADGDRDGAAGARRPSRDLLDGGTGQDLASYWTRRQPVFVDLADARPDGRHGEGDLLQGVEAVYGGHGDDRLAGDDQANVLDGRGGRNRLTGRGGDDVLRSSGLPISCGPGHDVVTGDRPSGTFEHGRFLPEYLHRDCEDIESYANDLVLPARPSVVRGGRLAFRLRCPLGEVEPQVCSATMRLAERAAPGRLLATGRSRPKTSRGQFVWLRLSRAGHRLASRPNGVGVTARLKIVVEEEEGEGSTYSFVLRWGIRLATPR